MHENQLKELVRSLSDDDKAQLRLLLDDELTLEISAPLLAKLTERWAEVTRHLEDFVTIDEDATTLKSRRSAA